MYVSRKFLLLARSVALLSTLSPGSFAAASTAAAARCCCLLPAWACWAAAGCGAAWAERGEAHEAGAPGQVQE
eukprot:COSAG01_NODE_36588_length_515_cov_1.894231_1_plen_72_part_01